MVDRAASGLNYEHIRAAHALIYFDPDLFVGETGDGGLAERNSQVTGDVRRKTNVGGSREDPNIVQRNHAILPPGAGAKPSSAADTHSENARRLHE